MKNLITLLLSLFSICLCAQSIPDTLNQYNSNNKKHGYWICYLDSNFNICEKEHASYYGYEYYENGENPVNNFTKGKWRERCRKEYKPFANSTESPSLINGEVFFYYDSLYCYEKYINGIPKISEFYSYSDGKKKTARMHSETLYYDSLFNNKKESALYYEFYNDVLISKYYFSNHIQHITYTVPHTKFTSVNRPRFGYYYQGDHLLELGFSKKYSNGIIVDTTGQIHYEDQTFPGYTIAVGSSIFANQVIFNQKILYTQCIGGIVNFESGISNYTNFKGNDFRLTAGLGLTIMGRISLMYHYYLPMMQSPYPEIYRHSVSLIFY